MANAREILSDSLIFGNLVNMTLTELLISSLPMLIVLAGATLIIRKAGAFEQRDHRKRVEQLLERIANAVEKNSRP